MLSRLTDDGTIVVWGSDYWYQHEASGATGIRAIRDDRLGHRCDYSNGGLNVCGYYPVTDPDNDIRRPPPGIEVRGN